MGKYVMQGEAAGVRELRDLSETLEAEKVPKGFIAMWQGSKAPPGWTLYDGGPALKAVLPKGVVCVKKQ